MNRREALKQMAVLVGGAFSYSTVAGVMGGCRATGDSFSPKTLSPSQNLMVIDLTEQIIPSTDTPGAKAAKVNQFIDHMLTNWNTEAEKKHFLEGLDHVSKLSNSRKGENFVDLSHQHQIEIMEMLEQEAFDKPEHASGPKPFFSMLKELTVVGYYTSEIGANQELNLNLIPGYYDGCKPYSEIGKAWSAP